MSIPSWVPSGAELSEAYDKPGQHSLGIEAIRALVAERAPKVELVTIEAAERAFIAAVESTGEIKNFKPTPHLLRGVLGVLAVCTGYPRRGVMENGIEFMQTAPSETHWLNRRSPTPPSESSAVVSVSPTMSECMCAYLDEQFRVGDGTAKGHEAGVAAVRNLCLASKPVGGEPHPLEGGTDHPEDRCERCGGKNIVWFADSDTWNAHHGEFDILCPLCFAVLAEAGGFKVAGWRLAPGDHSDEAGRLMVALREARDELERQRPFVGHLKWCATQQHKKRGACNCGLLTPAPADPRGEAKRVVDVVEGSQLTGQLWDGGTLLWRRDTLPAVPANSANSCGTSRPSAQPYEHDTMRYSDADEAHFGDPREETRVDAFVHGLLPDAFKRAASPAPSGTGTTELRARPWWWPTVDEAQEVSRRAATGGWMRTSDACMQAVLDLCWRARMADPEAAPVTPPATEGANVCGVCGCDPNTPTEDAEPIDPALIAALPDLDGAAPVPMAQPAPDSGEVERVARELHKIKCEYHPGTAPWDQLGEFEEQYRRMAVAALTLRPRAPERDAETAKTALEELAQWCQREIDASQANSHSNDYTKGRENGFFYARNQARDMARAIVTPPSDRDAALEMQERCAKVCDAVAKERNALARSAYSRGNRAAAEDFNGEEAVCLDAASRIRALKSRSEAKGSGE